LRDRKFTQQQQRDDEDRLEDDNGLAITSFPAHLTTLGLRV
jgi:hypothetical protein